jgi:phosphoribosyl 1,2-cyclic phosphodiesterase
LGSGSKGNAALVVSQQAKILIDDGFSYRDLLVRVASLGETLDGLQGVFLTHEHQDHVRGVGVLSRKMDVPIYMTRATFEHLPPVLGRLSRVECIESGDEIRVGDIEVKSYGVSHDAADPVCYIVSSQGARLGFAHDLGHSSQLVQTRLKGCHALVLESNYCPDLLRRGGYPPAVQQRIRSRSGHLSNQDMSSLLNALLHDHLKTVVLNHISETNNRSEIVQQMASGVLRDHGALLHIALQDSPTPWFEVYP